MRRHWKLLSVITVAALMGLVQQIASRAQDGVRPIPDTLPPERKVEVKAFMHAKLTNAQRVLQGLLTKDFDQVGRSAATLRNMSLTGPVVKPRQEFDDKVYDHFRTEFMRLSVQLERMAIEKNLEGAAFVHQSLTATCIACHQHIRDERKGGVGER